MSNTKEIKNFLEKMFKNSAKSYGYKVISGIPYKEINGALFDIILQTSTSKDGVQMRCSLHYKPLYCDYALWAVMGVDDEMSRQPFSIHSNGAFVAPSVNVFEKIEFIVSTENVEKIIGQIYKYIESVIAETSFQVFDDIYIKDKNKSYGLIRNILYNIGKHDFSSALSIIENSIQNGQTGYYVIADREFMKSAKEFCMRQMKK